MTSCPFEFHPIEENEKIKSDFLGYDAKGLVRSKPGSWVLGGEYGTKYADDIYNFKLREDDVWIVSYPKSGTTWTQQIVWLLLNDLDTTTQERIDLRSPFLDLDQCTPIDKFNTELLAKLAKGVDTTLGDLISEELAFMSRTRVQDANALCTSKRRCLKSHLPFELLPPELLSKNKVIYVARDPREVLVSYFHHHRLIRHHEFVKDFKEFFEYFLKEQVLWSPYWRHIEQAWSQRNNPNVLFVFFNDLKKDIKGQINRIASFLGVEHEDSKIDEVIEHLRIENMRGNVAVDDTDIMVQLGIFKEGEGSFVRDGKRGKWTTYMDDEMKKRMKKWMETETQNLELPMDKLWPNDD